MRSLRGDQIARMEARHQITEAQFAADRHYHSLHEIAFASALRSCDLTRPVIDQGRHLIEPFDDRQRDAIRRLRVIDGRLVVRLGIDVLELLQAVRWAAARWSARHGSWVAARRATGAPRSAWRSTRSRRCSASPPGPRRPPVRERYALQAAVMVTAVRKSAP